MSTALELEVPLKRYKELINKFGMGPEKYNQYSFKKDSKDCLYFPFLLLSFLCLFGFMVEDLPQERRH